MHDGVLGNVASRSSADFPPTYNDISCPFMGEVHKLIKFPNPISNVHL